MSGSNQVVTATHTTKHNRHTPIHTNISCEISFERSENISASSRTLHASSSREHKGMSASKSLAEEKKGGGRECFLFPMAIVIIVEKKI